MFVQQATVHKESCDSVAVDRLGNKVAQALPGDGFFTFVVFTKYQASAWKAMPAHEG